jgi:hypothetical protein
MNDVSPWSLTNSLSDTMRTLLLVRSEFNVNMLFTKVAYSCIAGSLLQLSRHMSILRINCPLFKYPSAAGRQYTGVVRNSSKYRKSTNSHKKFCTGRDAWPEL